MQRRPDDNAARIPTNPTNTQISTHAQNVSRDPRRPTFHDLQSVKLCPSIQIIFPQLTPIQIPHSHQRNLPLTIPTNASTFPPLLLNLSSIPKSQNSPSSYLSSIFQFVRGVIPHPLYPAASPASARSQLSILNFFIHAFLSPRPLVPAANLTLLILISSAFPTT